LRAKVQNRLKHDLLNRVVPPGLRKTKQLLGIGQAGEGLLFLVVVSGLVKEGGRMAFVLPKSLLTGISWFLVRCLLWSKFHLEHVVLSYDARNGYNFSESTSLSEVLIVARKRQTPRQDEETTITTMLSKPLTSMEARALALKILKAPSREYLEVNGTKAFVHKFSRKDLIMNLDNWGRLCAFPSPQLNELVSGIFLGKLYGKRIPITFLGDIVDVVGLAVRRGTFHEVFKQVRGRTPGALPALIGGEENLRRTITATPNAQVICKKPKYLYTASKFLVPDRVWVETTHALALYCDVPAVSNLFFGLRPLEALRLGENSLKALILWFNTTWGILSIFANRTETRGPWIELTTTKWKLLPVLNVKQLDDKIISKLVNIFDSCRRNELNRLPDQFNPDNIDPLRMKIDREFLEVIGIKVDEEELHKLYRMVYGNLKQWIEGSTLD
jgi:hypothetical protein